MGTKYGIPIETNCTDGKDNDGDGKIDCDDSDCAQAPGCMHTLYGIPYEWNCTDGLDNDGDGKTDCADPDCAADPACVGTKYGIPYETNCSDGIDNDNDGLTDCADPDCANAPGCMNAKYAAPHLCRRPRKHGACVAAVSPRAPEPAANSAADSTVHRAPAHGVTPAIDGIGIQFEFDDFLNASGITVTNPDDSRGGSLRGLSDCAGPSRIVRARERAWTASPKYSALNCIVTPLF
jgi:hypothetical protein